MPAANCIASNASTSALINDLWGIIKDALPTQVLDPLQLSFLASPLPAGVDACQPPVDLGWQHLLGVPIHRLLS